MPVNLSDKYWTKREQKYFEKLLLEGYRKSYPSIPLILIDREKTIVDPLLNETLKMVWKQPLYIPGQLQWSPAQDALGLFGITRRQDVLVTFPEIALRHCEIDPLDILTGAVMQLIGVGDQPEPVFYTILSVHQQPRDAFSLRGDIFDVAVTSERRTFQRLERGELPLDILKGFLGD